MDYLKRMGDDIDTEAKYDRTNDNNILSLRRTKIVCTLGPSSSNIDTIKEMLSNGMSIARLNFSHGTHEQYTEIFKTLKSAREYYPHFGVALDTRGPEIRLSKMKESLDVKKGDLLCFTNNEDYKEKIYFNFKNLDGLTINYIFSIDDGNLKMKVSRIHKDYIEAIAMNNHIIKPNKSANFPGVPLGIPFLSEKDKIDILFGIGNDIDFIFASFASSPNDIREIKELILNNSSSKNIPSIIAKIESKEGIKNLEGIVGEADGIMIARGDLGAEYELHEIFSLQKKITKMCLKLGKPVICATQMIESMINNASPTRAEIMNIGNAVYDGCDAVMTSAETSVGKFPSEVVEIIHKICLNAEKYKYDELQNNPDLKNKIFAALKLHNENNSHAIILATNSALEIRQIYELKPLLPVIVVSTDLVLLNRISLLKGFYSCELDERDGDFKMTNNERWQVSLPKIIQNCANKTDFIDWNRFLACYYCVETRELIYRTINY